MVGTRMRASLLVLFALAAGSCATALGDEPALAGQDAAFLASWLGMDNAGASKLASDGAAAASNRRALLQSAPNFGEAVLPGAYPSNPTTVTFTAELIGPAPLNINNFDRKKYMNLITAQVFASQVGKVKPKTPVITLLKVTNRPGGGVFVRTQVVMFEKVTAQNFFYRITIDPGTTPPWLTNPYQKGSNLLQFATTVPCNSKLCKFCFTNPAKCDQCSASTGKKGTPSYRTVFKNKAGQCAVCANKNCATCKPGGTGAGQCAVCAASTQIYRYGRFITVSIYKNKAGVCGPCLALNCKTCATNGLCQICNTNYSKRDLPARNPGYCIRTKGPDPWRPRP